MTTLFICEDQNLYREALKMLLKKHLHIRVVGEALDGEEALPLIKKYIPDVCLIDLSMPKMNGIDLVKKLNNEIFKTKKIILSQNTEPFWVEKLVSNQIDAFVLKTDPEEHILLAIESVMKGEKYFSPSVAVLFYQILSQSHTETENNSIQILSQREREVALHTSQGMTVKEIAKILNCSENTIKTHKSNLMRKIEARNSSEVTAWVLNNKKTFS